MHDLPAVDCTQLCHLPPTPKAAFNKITGPCTEIKFHDQVHLETCSLYIHIVHASVMEEPSLNNFQLNFNQTSSFFKLQSPATYMQSQASCSRNTRGQTQNPMTEMSSAVLVANTKRMKLPVAWQQIYKTNFVLI